MGQKVNPHGLRVGVIKDWDSRWYARNDKVGEDVYKRQAGGRCPPVQRCLQLRVVLHRGEVRLRQQAHGPVSYTHLDVYKRQAYILAGHAAQRGGISSLPCSGYGGSWRGKTMSKLLPYETIVKAHEGDPDAIDTVLSHYVGYIRYCSKVHGKVSAEVEEHIKQKLIAALFKFRFDR